MKELYKYSLYVTFFIFSSSLWAGCADYPSQCVVIENGKPPKEIACKVSSCGNVHGTLFRFDIKNRHYLSTDYDSKGSSYSVDGQSASKAKIDGMPEVYSCYKSNSSSLTLCGIER